MENRKNPLMTNDDVNRQRLSSQRTIVLVRWFKTWMDMFPSHQITQNQMNGYLEALDDLTPEQIDVGCREASRTTEVFPKPAHIRAAMHTYYGQETVYSGPPQLTYPEISQEEREAALEFSQKVREHFAKDRPKDGEPGKKKLTIVPSKLSIEEQKAELKRRGYLK
jgi:hypothetical protein